MPADAGKTSGVLRHLYDEALTAMAAANKEQRVGYITGWYSQAVAAEALERYFIALEQTIIRRDNSATV